MAVEHINQPTLEKVLWRDVREALRKVNPKFAKVIDAIKPKDEFILYLAKYPFGSTIIDGSHYYLPFNGSLIPLDDPRIPSDLKAQLGYNSYVAGSVPLAVNLGNSTELYMQQADKIIPFSLLTKGKIFGLWGSLNRNFSYSAPKVWRMTAGARCIFFLPKITDTPSFKKLSKARNIKLPLPRNLLDQGPILAQIAKHKNFPSVWHTETLIFPRKWLEQRKGEAWANFHLYLHEQAWEGTEYWRNKVVYDCVWDSFVKDLAHQNIKVMPYIVDIVEHLIMVGLGVLPGFGPAINNTQGPIEGFQSDFLNIYGLKHFVPTIMVPKHINNKENNYVYWSLQLPTYFESTPKARTVNSVVNDLREIMNLLERFKKSVTDGKIPSITGTVFYNFIKKIQFDFFHSDIEINDSIKPSRIMPFEDKELINHDRNKNNSKGFSEISPFVRGCVRISFSSEEV